MKSSSKTMPPELLLSSDSDWPPPVVWKPHDYQRLIERMLLKHPEVLVLAEPGLGKTSPLLDAFLRLKEAKAVRKALVVAPLRPCYSVWTRDHEDGEIRKWSQFNGLREVLLHGDGKEDRLLEDGDLYVINPEGLQWLIDGGGLERLLRHGVDMLVIDEISMFKDPKTKRFKALKPFLKRFKRRVGLTGSPNANGLLDLFGQAFIVDLGRTLGKFITHYRLKYFIPTGYNGYKWEPQPDAEERIYEAMANLAIGLKAEDHLDMPELVERNIWVDLPKPIRKIYDDLHEEMLALIDGEEVTAVNAAVVSSKCRQVASGGIYLDRVEDDGEVPTRTRIVKQLHDEKTDAVEELLGELQGQPLLLAYEFHHDLARLQKRFGTKKKPLPYIAGGVNPKEAARLQAAWNHGDLPLLACHPASMARGVNLQKYGHHVGWYSLTWNYEWYDQTNRRVWRQGQKHSRVIVHRFLTRKTVDELVLAAINTKRRGHNSFFDALQRLGKARRHRRT
jgi:hypothetical protein